MENFKNNSNQYLGKFESKNESIIWDIQTEKSKGFYPIQKLSENPPQKQEKNINKENSLIFLKNHFNSILSIPQLTLVQNGKEKVEEDAKTLNNSEKTELPQEKQKPTNICKCSKSKCLKLYCECFANGRICGIDCNCKDCHNIEQYEDLRKMIQAEAE